MATMDSMSLLLLILFGPDLSLGSWRCSEGNRGDRGLDWMHGSGFKLGTVEVEGREWANAERFESA